MTMNYTIDDSIKARIDVTSKLDKWCHFQYHCMQRVCIESSKSIYKREVMNGQSIRIQITDMEQHLLGQIISRIVVVCAEILGCIDYVKISVTDMTNIKECILSKTLMLQKQFATMVLKEHILSYMNGTEQHTLF